MHKMGNLIFDGKGIIGHDLIVKMKRSIEMLLQGFPPITVNGTAKEPITTLTVYGHSTQDGTPSPENPVPILSAGDSGEIEAKVYGGNLISSDVSSWNCNGWSSGSMLQLSDGIKIKAINGWKKAYYDTSEMNGKTLNLSFRFRQIESETTSPITRAAFAVVVQDENIFPSEASDIFPFRIDSPETVKTHVSVSFIARNYLCLFLRVNTEGQEAGETRAIEVTNIMLNAGSTALAFEPYVTPQTLILSTPGGLPGIPVSSGGNYTDENGQQWVCDEIDLARGKYVQRVGKTVVDGTEIKFTATSEGDYWNLPHQSAPGISEIRIAISKYFPINAILGNIEYSFLFTIPTLISPYFSLVDELNAFCAEKYADGQPLEIYYIMAPIETDLPAEEIAAYKTLHTYSPTTTVSNDAAAWMEVGVIME